MCPHKKIQGVILPSFWIFWYDKKGKIQFLPKRAKVANNKNFLFTYKILWKLGNMEINNIGFLWKKFKTPFFRIFDILPTKKWGKFNFCNNTKSC